jgi:hypothetical protein
MQWRASDAAASPLAGDGPHQEQPPHHVLFQLADVSSPAATIPPAAPPRPGCRDLPPAHAHRTAELAQCAPAAQVPRVPRPDRGHVLPQDRRGRHHPQLPVRGRAGRGQLGVRRGWRRLQPPVNRRRAMAAECMAAKCMAVAHGQPAVLRARLAGHARCQRCAARAREAAAGAAGARICSSPLRMADLLAAPLSPRSTSTSPTTTTTSPASCLPTPTARWAAGALRLRGTGGIRSPAGRMSRVALLQA